MERQLIVTLLLTAHYQTAHYFAYGARVEIGGVGVPSVAFMDENHNAVGEISAHGSSLNVSTYMAAVDVRTHDGVSLAALAAEVAEMRVELATLRAELATKVSMSPSLPPTTPVPPTLPPSPRPPPPLPPSPPPPPPPKVIQVSGACDPNMNGLYTEYTGTASNTVGCPTTTVAGGVTTSCFMQAVSNTYQFSCRMYVDSSGWGFQCACGSYLSLNVPACASNPSAGEVFSSNLHHRVYSGEGDTCNDAYNSPETCSSWRRRPGCGACGCSAGSMTVTLSSGGR